MIPISVVDVPEEAHALVAQVLATGQLAQGPMVERLESLAAAMAGVDHVVAVNNGTTALVLAIEALGLGPGDEVITSPFTFVATLNAILESGATARFGDVGDDYCLDPATVEPLVGPSTAALMPVHLYGQTADMDAMVGLSGRAGVALVEDAAQSHGATFGGRPAGSFGVGCFSLYATKNVTTGEGGLVSTSDPALADRMRVLRNQGMRARYQYEVPGHNYRLTDLQAAVGVPQLERLGLLTERRNANAAVLAEGLAGIDGLVVPRAEPGRTHVWHQFTVRITAGAPVDRDTFVERLAAEGVGAGVYYPRTVYDYDCYRSHPRVVIGESPRAEGFARQVVSLPVHPRLTDADLNRIVEVVRTVLQADRG